MVRGPAAEEVVVTAQRRAQNAEIVPVAMTALTSRALQARSIQSVADLAAATPNLFYTDDGTGHPPPITLRGISGFTKEPGIDQAQALYVDDIYVAGNDALAALNFYDVDHVEVLRGPQGTLFGRNALAGALNITTRMPSDSASADLHVTYGTYDLRQLTGILNMPLLPDRLILNLAVSGTKHAGYVDDTTTHSDIDSKNDFGWRLKVLARPSDDLTILLTGEHQRNDAPSGAGVIAFYNKAPLLPLPAALAPFFATDPRIVASDPTPDPYDLTSVEAPAPRQHYLEDLVGLRATLQTGFGTLTSISAYRHNDFAWTTSAGGAPVPFASATDQNAYQSWSQELRLSTKIGSYADIVAGTYFSGERSDNTPHLTVGQAYADDFQHALTNIENAFGPGLGGFIDRAIEAAFPVQAGTAQANAATDIHAYAGYVHAIGHILPALDVIIGGRYTYEQRSIDFSQTSNPFLQASAYPVVAAGHAGVGAANFSPLVTISYRPRADLLGYLTFSEGFKGGGYNNYYATGSTSDAAARGILTPFQPETLRNYELGIKTSLFGGRVMLDADAFTMSWHNRQLVEQVVEIAGSNFQTVNCCDLDVIGAELQATARPFDHLLLRASYGTNQPKVTSSANPVATGVHTGDILDMAPHYNAGAGLELDTPMTDRYVCTLTADYNYRGHWALNNTNPRIVQNAFGLLDARLSFGPKSAMWSIGLWGKNLTDTRWSASALNTAYAFPFLGTYEYEPAPPRTLGIDLNLRL